MLRTWICFHLNFDNNNLHIKILRFNWSLICCVAERQKSRNRLMPLGKSLQVKSRRKQKHQTHWIWGMSYEDVEICVCIPSHQTPDEIKKENEWIIKYIFYAVWFQTPQSDGITSKLKYHKSPIKTQKESTDRRNESEWNREWTKNNWNTINKWKTTTTKASTSVPATDGKKKAVGMEWNITC